MHSKHPEISETVKAIFRVLVAAGGSLTCDEIADQVRQQVPTTHTDVYYYLQLLVDASRLNVVVYQKKLGRSSYVTDSLYSIRNPLDGLAAI
jgi:Fe2+ or Zn2+ uptake regulation protein